MFQRRWWCFSSSRELLESPLLGFLSPYSCLSSREKIRGVFQSVLHNEWHADNNVSPLWARHHFPVPEKREECPSSCHLWVSESIWWQREMMSLLLTHFVCLRFSSVLRVFTVSSCESPSSFPEQRVTMDCNSVHPSFNRLTRVFCVSWFFDSLSVQSWRWDVRLIIISENRKRSSRTTRELFFRVWREKNTMTSMDRLRIHLVSFREKGTLLILGVICLPIETRCFEYSSHWRENVYFSLWSWVKRKLTMHPKFPGLSWVPRRLFTKETKERNLCHSSCSESLALRLIE